MIHLLDFTVTYDPPSAVAPYLVEARFIDTDDIQGWDKSFSMCGPDLEDLIARAEYQITCVMSAEDPKDMRKLNYLFWQGIAK